MKPPPLSLADQLGQLKLYRMLELHQEAASEAARKNLGYLKFLESLVSEELSFRFSRRVVAYVKLARIPVLKTLDAFDWNHPRRIPKQKILNLFDLDFVSKKSNAIFLGPSGLGKTHLAQALAYQACSAGITTYFATAIDIINRLTASLSDHTFLHELKRFTKPELLAVDELGYLPVDKQGADLLFQVISARYERGSIVLTSNRVFKDWGKIFNNDNTIASAIIDRLVHHCEVILIEGDSYRTKDKIKLRD